MSIEVKSLVKVQRIDGETTPVGSNTLVEVKNARNNEDWVALRICLDGGETEWVTVSAIDLEAAIRNATNVGLI